MYASAPSFKASNADPWNRRSVLKSLAISRTSLSNRCFLMKSSTVFWYFLISRNATVPGLYLCGFFTLVVAGVLFSFSFSISLSSQNQNVRSMVGKSDDQQKECPYVNSTKLKRQ